MSGGAYAHAGVDPHRAGSAVDALVAVLRTIETGRPPLSVLASGHYASVIRLDERTGIALCTDGVGSKVIVAEQLERFDTIGIDCVAMSVNDIACVGARPLALLDYVAVERAEPEMLGQIGLGLKEGAERAGVEIPGGELAELPELIRGHPSPRGFDLAAACVGTVSLDRLVTGARATPGDVVIGLPSSGVHANGFTLARHVLARLDETPPELGGASVGEALLEPTTIYVRAVLELLESGLDVRGLAHVTGDGLLNLARLDAAVGYRIDDPLAVPPILALIAARAETDLAGLWEVFNMGCGFCCVVAADDAGATVDLLAAHHPGTRAIGEVTDRDGLVEVPPLGLAGRRGRGFERSYR